MEPTLPMPNSDGLSQPQPTPAGPSDAAAQDVTPQQSQISPTSNSMPPMPVAVPVTPTPTQSAPTPSGQDSNDSSDAPLIADDVDVIEKEWVEKAKKIVHQTKTDPHEQEKAISKLQADYLMKRYNKQVKVSE